MEQKRYLLFFSLSAAFLLVWLGFVVPRLVPPRPAAQKKPAANAKAAAQPPKAEQVVAKDEAASQPANADPAGEKPASAPQPADKPEIADKPQAAEQPDTAEKPPAEIQPVKYPRTQVLLGSIENRSDYRQLVTLTSRGAAVERIELNDPRYTELVKPHRPLSLIEPALTSEQTLLTTSPQFQKDLAELDWEVVPGSQTESAVDFRLFSGDRSLELLKRYRLGKLDDAHRANESPAYLLRLDLTVKNHSAKPQIVNYEMQGPVGLPLENLENTQKHRDIVVGFLKPDGSIDHKLIPAKTIADAANNNKLEEWNKPFKYIGADVQYFAVLVLPVDDQLQSPYFKTSQEELLGKPNAEKSQVGVRLSSVDLALPAAKKGVPSEATHAFELFAGPKRDDVLPDKTSKVLDYGMFSSISRPMLWLLGRFYTLFGSYGVAIICLTVVVRGSLFPLSIKQARSAAKMQELQPELAELREKIGKDKEKMLRAQQELFRKHNYNPFAGCLPVLFQLPIFMGLYQALNHSVDLRMAPFLWINNLAAPDALFPLPMRIPLLGWTDFNLLPFITTGLFTLQQKMFMPPPANEEQAMQQKMMTYMTVFMGIMFYRVPAGLCVYFIASSLWGMAERKLLPKKSPAALSAPRSPVENSRPKPTAPPADKDDDASLGFLGRLLKAAEKEVAAKKLPPGKRR